MQTEPALEVSTQLLYEPVPNWGQFPKEVQLDGDATSVGTNSEGHVFIFNRGTTPVIVLDRQGHFFDSWGTGEFDKPHSIKFDDQDNIYLVDMGAGLVDKRTPHGKLSFRLGQDAVRFQQVTDVAIAPDGTLFVANARGDANVYRFDADGTFIQSWGESGSDPGQFSIPHSITISDNGTTVAICDRENFRIQKFAFDGEFIEQIHLHRPSAATSTAFDTNLYVTEQGPPPFQHGLPNLGCRVSILDASGRVIGRLGSPVPGYEPDQFVMPHHIAVDKWGDIYVAECAHKYIEVVLGLGKAPEDLVTLKKWRRVTTS
jgi:DNA-binding beta-propeller fold protein YncE